MDHFNYQDGVLFAEEVDLRKIAAQWGTPAFVYSRATLERHWHAFDNAFGKHPHLVCYAVKANPNLAVLNLFARLGSGFDIVSQGELERVLAAGGDANKIIFSGVGKQRSEIARALEVGIRCFNVESQAELIRINEVAASLGKVAPISIRVNPDVDAKTHPYIATGLKENKFGINMEDALAVYLEAAQCEHLNVEGIDCHIGSQLTDIAPFLDALDRLVALVDQLGEHNINITHLDLGGGLGVRYKDEQPYEPAQYAEQLVTRLKRPDLTILIEPGRAIAANAGILLTKVEYLKPSTHKNFAIVDAAMNDLLRPALYQAWQEIVPVVPRAGNAAIYDVVGPVCETGDFLGKDRALTLMPDDLLAIRGAGAYAFTMSSNYNSRPRAPEIMVDGSQHHLIRPRETLQDLFAQEAIIPDTITA